MFCDFYFCEIDTSRELVRESMLGLGVYQYNLTVSQCLRVLMSFCISGEHPMRHSVLQDRSERRTDVHLHPPSLPASADRHPGGEWKHQHQICLSVSADGDHVEAVTRQSAALSAVRVITPS